VGTPDLTVCMATRNQSQYLSHALTSLQAQTLERERYEVIVIDDGSDDETLNILRTWTPWIRLVSRGNRGLVASCNEGLDLAKGRYFARMDSDDAVHPAWLACMVRALDDAPQSCLAYPDRIEMEGLSSRRVRCDAADIYSLQACGTVFRADVLRHAGGFRPFFWEEYDLYLRLRNAGAWEHVPLPLYTYRKHDAAMTADADARLSGWKQLASEWGADTLRACGSHSEMERSLMLFESGQ
jgi:glycosyltransferase involved in cell wall biosynthesis